MNKNEKVMVEIANGLKLLSYQEMLDVLATEGIEMEYTGEYWKAVRYTGRGQYDVIWQDSAAEEAYDECSAIVMTYSVIAK